MDNNAKTLFQTENRLPDLKTLQLTAMIIEF